MYSSAYIYIHLHAARISVEADVTLIISLANSSPAPTSKLMGSMSGPRVVSRTCNHRAHMFFAYVFRNCTKVNELHIGPCIDRFVYDRKQTWPCAAAVATAAATAATAADDVLVHDSRCLLHLCSQSARRPGPLPERPSALSYDSVMDSETDRSYNSELAENWRRNV